MDGARENTDDNLLRLAAVSGDSKSERANTDSGICEFLVPQDFNEFITGGKNLSVGHAQSAAT